MIKSCREKRDTRAKGGRDDHSVNLLVMFHMGFSKEAIREQYPSREKSQYHEPLRLQNPETAIRLACLWCRTDVGLQDQDERENGGEKVGK